MNRARTSAAIFVCLAVAALGARPLPPEGRVTLVNPVAAGDSAVSSYLPGQSLPVSRQYTYRIAG